MMYLELYQYQSKEPLSTPSMSQNHTKFQFHVLSQSLNPTRSTQSNKLLKPQSSTRRLSPFNNPLYTPLSNNMSKLMLPQLLPSDTLLPQLPPSESLLPQPPELLDTLEPSPEESSLPQLAPSPLPQLMLLDSGLLTKKLQRIQPKHHSLKNPDQTKPNLIL